jgi:thiol-disulfide isomerase/thioredoxin
MARPRLWSALGLFLLAGIAIGSLKLRPTSAQENGPREQAPLPSPAASARENTDTKSSNEDPTASSLRAALLNTAARLDNVKISFVERGDNVQRPPDAPVPVVHKEIWAHGQSAQARIDWRENGNGESWWEGFRTHDKPLTSADLETLPGLKLCFDRRRSLAWADSRPLGPSDPKTLHSVSKSPHWPVGFFLPLLTLDKPWGAPALESWSPIVNRLASRPLASWKVVGEERLETIECVKAEINIQDPVAIPLKRHAGDLTLRPIYLAWFAKAHGLMPVRVEQSGRYGFGGRDYALVRTVDRLAHLVYEASDFRLAAGIWMPYSGRQATYHSIDNNAAANQFDPDALVDKLLAEGKCRWDDKLQESMSQEWRILSMKSIDPALELWFEPQRGAAIHNVDTDERAVQGDPLATKKFAEEYQAIKALIGKPAPDFPKGAAWLNGEPLTWQALRGKVVILDFWATTCGACYNALPDLVQLHAGRESNGLVIIGIHDLGTPPGEIKEVLKQHDIHYPICIDVPASKDETGWGDFTSRFAVGAIPHFVAVDPNGIVIASETNRFEAVLTAARTYQAANPTKSQPTDR